MKKPQDHGWWKDTNSRSGGRQEILSYGYTEVVSCSSIFMPSLISLTSLNVKRALESLSCGQFTSNIYSFPSDLLFSSTAIENLQQLAKIQPKCAVVYWYFTFTDIEKQSLSNCILSLLGDVYNNLRETPPGLQEAFNEKNSGRQQPTTKETLQLLREALVCLDNVFVCLDALDECPKSSGEREKLLDAVREIRSWGIEPLHFMVTSRREVDIEEAFDILSKDLGIQHPGEFLAVRVQGPQVEQDIKKFIQHRVQDRVFNTWTMKLKTEVEVTLAAQAEGMSGFPFSTTELRL
jgi:hypothetical protein